MSRAVPQPAEEMELPRELAEPGLLTDLMTLTEARLSLLVIITTFVGFCMASGSSLEWLQLFHAICGTTLAAAAAAVLNQRIETHVDRLMERTRHRPLPAGRMKPATALVLGIVLGLAGTAWLWLTTNAVAAGLAAATILIYIACYTPLKRRTSLCTIVGAVAGAIPPVIGWTAVRPTFDLGAWVLFGILFTWQMPHFLAIAWMYRDEYAQAGFVMIRRDDLTGSATATQSLLYTLALLVVTALPFFAGLNSSLYFVLALLLDSVMLVCALRFLFDRTRPAARMLFLASIFYLPLLLGLMIFTKS